MKLTLSPIDQIISDFEYRVANIQFSNRNAFDLAKDDLLTKLKALQLQDPVLVPYCVGNDIKDILRSISNAANARQDLRVAYAGGGSYKQLQGICVDYPMFTDLSAGFNVLIKPFDSTNLADANNAEHTLNQYLLYVLLSYPRGSVRVNFIDPNFVGLSGAFMDIVGDAKKPSLCRLLQNQSEIDYCLAHEMPKRMADINQMGDRYYQNNPRYEIFVMVNYPQSYQNNSNNLNMLIERGAQFGIQFVVLHDINTHIGDYNTYNILSRQNLFSILDNDQEIPNQPSYLRYTTNLFSQKDVFAQCIKYLKNGLEEDFSTTNQIAGFNPIPTIGDTTSIDDYFSKLENEVSKNVIMPSIAYSTYEVSSRGGFEIGQEQIPWQIEGNKKKNIVINYTWQSEERAIDLLNQIAMNILLSLPITKMHFTLINYNKDPWARFLDKNIDDRIVDVIYDVRKVPMFYSRLSKTMEEDSNNLGCSIERKNVEDNAIYRPYEVVVMNASDATSQGELLSLFRNGANSGIYFIIMNNTEDQTANSQQSSLLNQTPFLHTIEVNDDSVGIPLDVIQRANAFTRHKEWTTAAVNYINERSVVKVNHDWNAIINAPYPKTSPDMSVVIGYEQGTGTPVEYKLDISHSHYHSFVIGGTGSGKTTFLHNIILSLALKYKPEDLELYLIDLKGPEFGRYKQLRQSGAILVDKTDELITYEIVGNLVKKMRDRKELFGDSSDLSKYNKLHPNAPLPQVLLIVDECQNLFKTNSSNHELSRKIVEAITMIATEGRAFGIHLLMATQSLNNCPLLDPGVLSQFQDFYILPCVDTDAKMLVKTEHKEIVGQEADRMEREKEFNRGQCFLQGTDGYRRFKFNFISDDKRDVNELSQVEQFIQKSIEKATGHISNGQVFFSGRQNYSLYDNINHLMSEGRRGLIASAGQNISFAQTPNLIYLTQNPGQNILAIGYNDEQFVTRTSINMLLSLILSSRKNQLRYRFVVINCMEEEGNEYSELLKRLSYNGYIELINPKESGRVLASLCADIDSKSATPTVLTILSQERYANLKNDEPLSPKEDSDTASAPAPYDVQATLAVFASMDFGEQSNKKANAPAEVKTYRDALRFILQKGAENGVHAILQVNKSSEFALSKNKGFNSLDKTELYKMFGHVMFLQTDKDTESFFSMYDLSLSELQESENRLRAYYFKPDGGSSQLLSPYMLPMKSVQIGKDAFRSFLDVEATINEIIRNY